MSPMQRQIAGTIVGVVVAGVVAAVVEAIGHQVYPPPPDISIHDLPKLKDHIAGLPLPAFLFVLAAWGSGAFAGALVAGKIARPASTVPMLLVGGTILLGAIAMFVLIPHPLWFQIVGVATIALSTLAASRLVR